MLLLFATHNPGKITEMREIIAGLPYEIISATDAGVEEEPVEDGATLEENALKKARYLCARTGKWSFADDSGIFIDALGGRPGVQSAYWGAVADGQRPDEQMIVAHTLQVMAGVPADKRQAHFKSVVALVTPEGQEYLFPGSIPGTIVGQPRGPMRPRLAYDVLFAPDAGGGLTFAEMELEQKNALSHRGLAFSALRKFLESRAA